MQGAAPQLVHAWIRAEHRSHPASLRGPQLPAVDCAAHEGGRRACAFHGSITAEAGNVQPTGQGPLEYPEAVPPFSSEGRRHQEVTWSRVLERSGCSSLWYWGLNSCPRACQANPWA